MDPQSLSSTSSFYIHKIYLYHEPKIKVWSCKSHSPPWSQIGQSKGWFTNKNSKILSLAFFTL